MFERAVWAIVSALLKKMCSNLSLFINVYNRMWPIGKHEYISSEKFSMILFHCNENNNNNQFNGWRYRKNVEEKEKI